MDWTGERWVPGKSPGGIEEQHVARYEWAAGFCEGRRVVDVGCGCGAGADILLAGGGAIEAFDISGEAIEVAQRDCDSRIAFWQLDAYTWAQPECRATVDIAVCFEVLEHLERPGIALWEIARALVPGGLLLASTPNRAFHGRPRVPVADDGWHVREYNVREFLELIGGNGFRAFGWSGQWPPRWEVRPCSNRAPEFTIVAARKG